MRINYIVALLSAGICALIAYGFYSFNDNPFKVLLSVGSFVLLTTTLVMTLAVRFNDYRIALNTRIMSLVFFGAAFVINLLFSFLAFSMEAYVIINGILLLLYILSSFLIIRPRHN